MSRVPANLKCALTHTLLKEAVTLPCCNQVRLRIIYADAFAVNRSRFRSALQNVNDSAVRGRLVSSGLVCPICNTPNVSPDSVRLAVEKFSTCYPHHPAIVNAVVIPLVGDSEGHP
jgi:hypothetical protein